jgi:hypothetical protein
MPTAFGFHPHTCNRNVPRSGLSVCVTAVYNPTGDIRPVAFGLEIDGMRYRYTIKEIKVTKETPGQFIFDCDYVDLGRIKAVRLIFDVVNCRWMVG